MNASILNFLQELDKMKKTQCQQQEELVDMRDRIELLTVEREMAEERADLLQVDIHISSMTDGCLVFDSIVWNFSKRKFSK